jgi:hypothetical protein
MQSTVEKVSWQALFKESKHQTPFFAAQFARVSVETATPFRTVILHTRTTLSWLRKFLKRYTFPSSLHRPCSLFPPSIFLFTLLSSPSSSRLSTLDSLCSLFGLFRSIHPSHSLDRRVLSLLLAFNTTEVYSYRQSYHHGTSSFLPVTLYYCQFMMLTRDASQADSTVVSNTENVRDSLLSILPICTIVYSRHNILTAR